MIDEGENDVYLFFWGGERPVVTEIFVCCYKADPGKKICTGDVKLFY